MTDLTLRAEGQLHTCNLVSKYRKAHSSVLEKSLSCQRARETVAKYLEVGECTYSKVLHLIKAACFVSEL